MSYPSDLSDAQWEVAGGRLFARPDPRGQPEKHAKRRVLEAIVLRLARGLPLAGAAARLPTLANGV
jgi:transposase